MKKYFAMMALAALSLCMFSCGGDDDEEGGSSGGSSGGGSGSGSYKAGVLDHAPDTRITKAGDYRFFYDEKGRLSYVTKNGYSEIELSYNPNRWTDDEGNEEATASYNGNGYLTSLKSNFDYTNEEGSEWATKVTGSASVTFSYDGNGHVTGATSTSKETKKDKEGTRTYDTNVKVTATWKSNLLTKVVISGKEIKKSSEGSRTESWTETWSFVYDDISDNTNKHHQYVRSVADWMDDFEPLAYVGIMGRGPLYLPNAATEEEVETEDGDTEKDTEDYTFSYTFNSNESVRSCTVKRSSSYSTSKTYEYLYETIGDDDDYKSRSFNSTHSSFVAEKSHNTPIADMIRSFGRRK